AADRSGRGPAPLGLLTDHVDSAGNRSARRPTSSLLGRASAAAGSPERLRTGRGLARAGEDPDPGPAAGPNVCGTDPRRARLSADADLSVLRSAGSDKRAPAGRLPAIGRLRSDLAALRG